MLETIGYANMAALIGLTGGILLGLAARFGRFCTLGAIEDWLYGHDDTRMRMWAVAIGVAVIGSFSLMALGLFDAETTAYLARAGTLWPRSRVGWSSAMGWRLPAIAAMARWRAWAAATCGPS